MSTASGNEVPRVGTSSPTPEGKGRDHKISREGALENNQQKVDESSDVTDKEAETEQSTSVGHCSSDTDSSSEAVNKTLTTSEDLPDKEDALIPNGHAISETNESSIPLIPSPKPSSSKISKLKRTLSKNSTDDVSCPVHTEVRLSSADFNVAVVTYKRSTSQDYTKIDVHDQEDDEDHSGLQYSDISTSWATSFWTQFSVLMVRTFKQSKPDILSRLNFVQVSRNSVKP